MIAVCLPSRGLIHSRTMECVLRDVKGHDVEFFFSHNLPIPDCFNEITNRALGGGANRLWFVEEDMYFPEGTLDKLIRSEARVATIDYPVSEDFSVWLEQNGEVMRFGTGCTLIDRSVFEEIGSKWRSNVEFVLPNWQPNNVNHQTYGLHDIEFAQRCRKAKIKVECVGRGNQYRLATSGKTSTNQGYHEIRMIT